MLESERPAYNENTAVNTCQSARGTLAPRHQAFLTFNSVETQHQHFTRPHLPTAYLAGEQRGAGGCYRVWVGYWHGYQVCYHDTYHHMYPDVILMYLNSLTCPVIFEENTNLTLCYMKHLAKLYATARQLDSSTARQLLDSSTELRQNSTATRRPGRCSVGVSLDREICN